ncbi:MAG: transcriptional regulator [Clostridia bacterium]|jgi:transcriptional regulator with XRE-family HTH domain|uniref:helix-turn-helix transcriptional regulator n=1 Tax=Bacteroides acidifaciens TaxID=85831 RepID=UPI002557D90F|nr:helix-turn-helix transcriptional regulator [Bacteroides acidifaciens]MCI9290318.1 transcriptional regulator [Clostridia bacterium]
MAKNPENSNNVSEKFQNRIKQIVDEQEFDKKDFPKFVDVSPAVIIRATKYGIIPSLKSLIKIADKVNVSLSYLLGETDNNEFYKSEHPTNFHIRLQELANERGEKYSAISNKMPFAYNSIYEWIRTGCLPSIDYLKPLAEYFKVSIDYLLGRTDDRNLYK